MFNLLYQNVNISALSLGAAEYPRGRGLALTLVVQVPPPRSPVAGLQGVWVLLVVLFAGYVSQRCCSCLDDDDDDPEDDDQEIRDKTLPRWQIWLAAERSRERRHWRPWRPDKTKQQTEEDCEDPERQAGAHPGGTPAAVFASPRPLRLRVVSA